MTTVEKPWLQTGLGNREVSIGGGASYLPLELTPGEVYEETFNFVDAGGQDTVPPVKATFRAGPPLHQRIQVVRVPYSGNGFLELRLESSFTAQLYALALMGRETVAEWGMAMTVTAPDATVTTILGRGPVWFREPRGRNKKAWIELGPDIDTKTVVGWLRGQELGEYQDGQSYPRGSVVTLGGKTFMAIADMDGTPGTGPNLDGSDPNTTTILTDVFPGPPTVVATDGTADGETSTAATATAGGTT